MDIHLAYAVTFEDFCASLRQYRRRSKGASFVYYLDVWVLPLLGALVVVTYLYGLATRNEHLTYTLGWLAIVGLVGAVGLPILYRLRLRKTYRQRTVLAEGGKVRVDANDESIRFVIDNKADVRYEWTAFSDFSEDRGVLTLFVQKSAFHTIPRHDLTDSDWAAMLQLVANQVRRF